MVLCEQEKKSNHFLSSKTKSQNQSLETIVIQSVAFKGSALNMNLQNLTHWLHFILKYIKGTFNVLNIIIFNVQWVNTLIAAEWMDIINANTEHIVRRQQRRFE